MTKKGVLLLYTIFVSVIVFCVFCKKESYKIEISKEITTIHNFNPIWGSKEKIKLKLLKKIEFNKKTHQRPWDLVQDKKGNKYVLIEDNIKGFDIIKFKPNWECIRKFRKKKREPNDIINARSLAIDNESNIYVVDKGIMYIHKFNPDGEFQKSIRMPYSSNKGCILNSGDIILIGRSFYSEKYGIVETKDPTMLIKINPNGEILKRFVECQKYSDPDLLYLANEIDFDVDGENNIYVTFQHQNRIEKYSRDGKLLFSADYPINYEINHKTGERKYSTSFPKLTFVSLDINVDSKKCLWVTTFKKQPKNQGTRASTLKNYKILKFEIFNNDGILLGEIPVPTRFRKKRIYNTNLYLIDPYFEMCIYEYKIIYFSQLK
ncbi:MAG: hypothetical protein U9Q27_01605 [Patescibacteria group bacterium]|nr:hypothetical protein [Patescibacteria group bacterium]